MNTSYEVELLRQQLDKLDSTAEVQQLRQQQEVLTQHIEKAQAFLKEAREFIAFKREWDAFWKECAEVDKLFVKAGLGCERLGIQPTLHMSEVEHAKYKVIRKRARALKEKAPELDALNATLYQRQKEFVVKAFLAISTFKLFIWYPLKTFWYGLRGYLLPAVQVVQDYWENELKETQMQLYSLAKQQRTIRQELLAKVQEAEEKLRLKEREQARQKENSNLAVLPEALPQPTNQSFVRRKGPLADYVEKHFPSPEKPWRIVYLDAQGEIRAIPDTHQKAESFLQEFLQKDQIRLEAQLILQKVKAILDLPVVSRQRLKSVLYTEHRGYKIIRIASYRLLLDINETERRVRFLVVHRKEAYKP